MHLVFNKNKIVIIIFTGVLLIIQCTNKCGVLTF